MPEAAPKADPRTKSVLIVDDDESMLNLLDILVRRDGFKVLAAGSVESALVQMANAVDAILLDLMLPDGSGIDLLRRLAAGGRPVPPVVVITAYSTHPNVREIQSNPHVVQLMSKPVRQEKLLELLHRILNTRSPKPPQ